MKKVLIANRGEVTARVARTCKRLGIETVGVFNEPDRESVHRQACDESVHIGPASLSESYLNQASLIAAAESTGCDAIHPGYGLLSEDVSFCRRVREAGLIFVGPTAEALERALDRTAVRQLALDAGVRILEGTHAAVGDGGEAHDAAEQVGYPLVVKAVRSGGGVGPKLAEHPEELDQALAHTRKRARERFGDDRVYLERALERPRHLEVQVVADGAGHIVAVGDRECSIQRGGLRLLDETPAPSLTCGESGRRTQEAMYDAAISVTREAGLTGAITCEFLLDADGRAYLLELRPRLQVAHGTTEMCTNLDLVEAQLLVAQGEAIPSEFERVHPSGHAMEVRISLDPGTRLGTETLEIKEVRWPNASPGRLRIEASVMSGGRYTREHDTLLAKVTSFAPTRHAAFLLLDRVLAESSLAPLPTNSAFLRRILAHESFRAGQYDTSFVAQLGTR